MCVHCWMPQGYLVSVFYFISLSFLTLSVGSQSEPTVFCCFLSNFLSLFFQCFLFNGIPNSEYLNVFIQSNVYFHFLLSSPCRIMYIFPLLFGCFIVLILFFFYFFVSLFLFRMYIFWYILFHCKRLFCNPNSFSGVVITVIVVIVVDIVVGFYIFAIILNSYYRLG